MSLRKSSSYEKNLGQLKMFSPSGGLWIDAGCGDGAYTLPLATLVEKVVALDRDESALNDLRNRLTPDLAGRIEIRPGDIYSGDIHRDELNGSAHGVLFAFSLHYSNENEKAVASARRALRDSGGDIIIIDYCSALPKPWVPRPFTPKKAEKLLRAAGFEVEMIFRNDRFFIMRGRSRPG